MNNESEFYVGYLPTPAGLKQTIRRVVVGLVVGAIGVAGILIACQHPFANATFEFQQYREFRGTLIAEPYPALAIPGQGAPWLLAAPGKHGVGDLRSLDGRDLTLTGERIIRGDDHMLEIKGQPFARSATIASRLPDVELGEVRL